MTILYDPARKKEPSATYSAERETCLKYFERWSETDQVEFVEHLLARMCHYQHGHINSYLKPMLQRDFISLLPSKCILYELKEYYITRSGVLITSFRRLLSFNNRFNQTLMFHEVFDPNVSCIPPGTASYLSISVPSRTFL